MPKQFTLAWTPSAAGTFAESQNAAVNSKQSREETGKAKASKQEGLFKQVVKCLTLLESNPRHPGLRTDELTSIEHPYRKGEKVFEACVLQNTPGAYRLFWCYGPSQGEITIIAITPHP